MSRTCGYFAEVAHELVDFSGAKTGIGTRVKFPGILVTGTGNYGARPKRLRTGRIQGPCLGSLPIQPGEGHPAQFLRQEKDQAQRPGPPDKLT